MTDETSKDALAVAANLGLAQKKLIVVVKVKFFFLIFES